LGVHLPPLLEETVQAPRQGLAGTAQPLPQAAEPAPARLLTLGFRFLGGLFDWRGNGGFKTRRYIFCELRGGGPGPSGL